MQGMTRILLILLLALTATAAFAQQAPALAPLIVIDPGHGGPYSNANANGLREKNVNLAVSLELRRQLMARGYRVSMTRYTDRAVCYGDIPTWNWSPYSYHWYLQRDRHSGQYGGIPKDDLQARVNVANHAGADLFIAIHQNGSANRSARGTETYASPRDPLGISLASMVNRRIVYRTGLYNRGAKTTDFYVVRWSNMPAVLVEGAFITNASDAWKLKQYTYRRRMAIGIAEAVHSWFASKPFTAAVAEESAPNAAAAALVMSKGQYPSGASVAVIARLDRWTDAPTVSILNTRWGGPLLWSGSTLSSTNASELARLSPDKVILAGYGDSFSQSFVSQVASASSLPTSAVHVFEAPGRAELSAAIATSMTPIYATQVIFADENDLPGILGALGAATRSRIPILLTRNGRPTAAGAQFLNDNRARIKTVVLMGPWTKTPSSQVPTWCTPVRLDTSNVYGAASAINARYFRTSGAGSMPVLVAEPSYGPGYITAASRAARLQRILAPVSPRVLPDETRLWQTNRRPQIGSFLVFDARSSIPPLMGHMLKKADR